MASLDKHGQSKWQQLSRRGFFGVAAMAAGTASTYGLLGRTGGEAEAIPLAEAAGPPDGVRLGTHRIVWSVETDEPLVALTFDDGPHPELTPKILEILDRYDLKATFFVVGYHADRRADLVREAVARGHEIGNHTWMHDELTGLDADEARRAIALGERAVTLATGSRPQFFRPPRGQLTGTSVRYAAEIDSDIVLWSVGRGVDGVGDTRSVTEHVVDKVSSGDIVGLHDGIGREAFRHNLDGPGPIRLRRDVEVRALAAIIEGVLEKGLRPVTLSELLAVQQRPT